MDLASKWDSTRHGDMLEVHWLRRVVLGCVALIGLVLASCAAHSPHALSARAEALWELRACLDATANAVDRARAGLRVRAVVEDDARGEQAGRDLEHVAAGLRAHAAMLAPLEASYLELGREPARFDANELAQRVGESSLHARAAWRRRYFWESTLFAAEGVSVLMASHLAGHHLARVDAIARQALVELEQTSPLVVAAEELAHAEERRTLRALMDAGLVPDEWPDGLLAIPWRELAPVEAHNQHAIRHAAWETWLDVQRSNRRDRWEYALVRARHIWPVKEVSHDSP